MKILKKKGFTLVELIVSIGIMGMIFSTVYAILLSGLKINSTVSARNNVQSDIRQTMVMMSDDIRKGVEFINDFSINSSTNPTDEVKPINLSTNLLTFIQANYTPIIYIKQLNNKLILYAAKKIENNMYELHKINLGYTNIETIKYNYDNNSLTNNINLGNIKVNGIDVEQVKYLSENYKISNNLSLAMDNITVLSNNYLTSGTTGCSISLYGYNDEPTTNSEIVQLPTNFYYYQGQAIFNCVYYLDSLDPSKNGYRTIKLIEKPREITVVSDTTISGNLSDIPKIISRNNGKLYNITVTAAAINYNTDYHKTLNSNVAVGNYGGDSDD